MRLLPKFTFLKHVTDFEEHVPVVSTTISAQPSASLSLYSRYLPVASAVLAGWCHHPDWRPPFNPVTFLLR